MFQTIQTSRAVRVLPPNKYDGRILHFGVREHAMGATLTGISLNGGLIPFGGTFLTFSDYMRPAIRLAALSEVQVIYVFTHDSVGLGEDGPTHQPIEHVAALRAIPHLFVIRPADPAEVSEAWRIAILRRQRSNGFSADPTKSSNDRSKPLCRCRRTATRRVCLGGSETKDGTNEITDFNSIATGLKFHWRWKRARSCRQKEFQHA